MAFFSGHECGNSGDFSKQILSIHFSLSGVTSSVLCRRRGITSWLSYFSGQSVGNSVNIILLSTPQVFTNGNGSSINGSWTNIFADLENNTLCAYGIQVEITDTDNGVVSLSHSNSDAKLMAIPYSTDFRSSRATFAGMTQKPIARKFTACLCS